MNILDWSCENKIGIALGETVYLWSYPSGELKNLRSYESNNNPTSLTFDIFSEKMAVGTLAGNVDIWDTAKG